MLAALELGKLLFLAGAFGLFATAHVALLWQLVLRPPRLRALLALLLPPLVGYFGYRAGQRVWCAVWIGSFSVYLVSALLASS